MAINRRVIAAVAALIFTLIGLVAVVGYVKGADDRAFEGTRTREVYRVTETIELGTKVSEVATKVEKVKLPVAAIPKDTVEDLDDLEGTVTNASLSPGEPLLQSRFSEPGETEGERNSSTPAGLQQVSVSLASERASGGMISVGDKVGIIASYDDGKVTKFVTNRAIVAALSSTVGKNAANDQANRQVTLAVDAEVAAKVINAAVFGHLWLTIQDADSKIAETRVTVKDVIQ